MTSRHLVGAATVAALVALALPAGPAKAQQTTRSTRDGVYTLDQAKRGRTAYSEVCFECHGRDLLGDVETRPLTGYLFQSNWEGSTMLTLFDRVRITMPADKAGTLSREKVADILAFILNSNDFPAGNTELSTKGEVLQQIRFDLPKNQ